MLPITTVSEVKGPPDASVQPAKVYPARTGSGSAATVPPAVTSTEAGAPAGSWPPLASKVTVAIWTGWSGLSGSAASQISTNGLNPARSTGKLT